METRHASMPMAATEAAPILGRLCLFGLGRLAFRVWGLGFRIEVQGFRVWGFVVCLLVPCFPMLEYVIVRLHAANLG